MNLLDALWIPIRRADGARQRIAPYQLTERIEENPVVALDAPRADFNGALAQFLIGVVQTAWLLSDDDWDRGEMLRNPPSPEQLQARFQTFHGAFELDGDGPRFMQDLTLNASDKPTENSIAALLIEAPGEQALKRNTDHFIKRGGVQALCHDCAATALFTLMTNAPSGGAGYRTSLRGGGPLTTLVVYEPDSPEHPPHALWRDIASNVLDRATLRSTTCDLHKTKMPRVFPWMAAQAALQKTGPKAEIQPLDVHPAHMYWAMPRRIRLDFEHATHGTCGLCARGGQPLISRYLTKNYGLNYKGPWRHPLSPYYRANPGDAPLPIHAQADGLGYRHWLGWVLGLAEAKRSIEPALTVQNFYANDTGGLFRLWVFGFDLDNMKARGWHEATFPLFSLPPESPDAQESLRGLIGALLAGATHAAQNLRWAIRDVWFGNGETRGDLGFIDASFWSSTQTAFFEHVRQAFALVQADAAGRPSLESGTPIREHWAKQLRHSVYPLFDRYAASGAGVSAHPERLAKAHRSLTRQLGKPLSKAVGLADKPAERPAQPYQQELL